MGCFVNVRNAQEICVKFGYFNKGWLQFVTALIVFVVMVLVWGAFRLADGPESFGEYRTITKMALGAFMSVAGYPLIYLFEKIFKLVKFRTMSNKKDKDGNTVSCDEGGCGSCASSCK